MELLPAGRVPKTDRLAALPPLPPRVPAPLQGTLEAMPAKDANWDEVRVWMVSFNDKNFSKKNGGLALKKGSLASKADLEAVEERGQHGWRQQAYAVEGSEPHRALVAFLGDLRCIRYALP